MTEKEKMIKEMTDLLDEFGFKSSKSISMLFFDRGIRPKDGFEVTETVVKGSQELWSIIRPKKYKSK